MTKSPDTSNPSAFPQVTHTYVVSDGMTLRDYFAGQAMAGMLADPDCSGDSTKIARYSYGIAQAMLEERAKW